MITIMFKNVLLTTTQPYSISDGNVYWHLVFPLTIAISILRGYGFVQYAEESVAREACKMENGSLMKGNKLGLCFLCIIVIFRNREVVCLINFGLSNKIKGNRV